MVHSIQRNACWRNQLVTGSIKTTQENNSVPTAKYTILAVINPFWIGKEALKSPRHRWINVIAVPFQGFQPDEVGENRLVNKTLVGGFLTDAEYDGVISKENDKVVKNYIFVYLGDIELPNPEKDGQSEYTATLFRYFPFTDYKERVSDGPIDRLTPIIYQDADTDEKQITFRFFDTPSFVGLDVANKVHEEVVKPLQLPLKFLLNGEYDNFNWSKLRRSSVTVKPLSVRKVR